ncbi:MAG: peptidoglycan DD-metalloendopeptidase family protein [Cellulosilyticaceae bacterium]
MKALIEHIKLKKKTYQIVIGVTLIGLSVGFVGLRKNAYAISVDGNVVAVVKQKEEAKVALETVVKTLKQQKGTDIAIKEEVTVEHINSKSNQLLSGQQVVETLTSAVTYDVEAFEILIDDTSYAIVESEAIAEKVLAEIAKQHLPGESEITLDLQPLVVEAETQEKEQVATEEVVGNASQTTGASNIEVVEVADAGQVAETKAAVKVGEVAIDEEAKKQEEDAKEGQKVKRDLKGFDFNEEVAIKNTYVPEEQILTAEEAIDVLLGNKEEIVEYEMKEGDNIWDIAMSHGTTMDHILEINPQIVDERKMQIGDMIKLEVPDPILSISTVEVATFKELIPAEIEYVEFSDLYKDETKVYQEGHDGLKEITVAVTKINGKEVSREGISENILTEPKTKVMAFGTKEKPKPKPSENSSGSGGAAVKPSGGGSFMHPLNGAGKISSPYGSRWGSFHRAIDIAAPAGTPIYASAAGTVVYSGYNNGGYGKMVIIDHGNGYRTYYAHNNSLYVQVGQKVSKGQNIASVGSTGNSTGNHVHFEIRKNGNPINPYSYIY